MNKNLISICIFLLIGLLPLSLWAQNGAGDIQGHVRDVTVSNYETVGVTGTLKGTRGGKAVMMTFDVDGRMTNENRYSCDINIPDFASYSDYEYDDRGNWTKRIASWNGRSMALQERVFNYYTREDALNVLRTHIVDSVNAKADRRIESIRRDFQRKEDDSNRTTTEVVTRLEAQKKEAMSKSDFLMHKTMAKVDSSMGHPVFVNSFPQSSFTTLGSVSFSFDESDLYVDVRDKQIRKLLKKCPYAEGFIIYSPSKFEGIVEAVTFIPTKGIPTKGTAMAFVNEDKGLSLFVSAKPVLPYDVLSSLKYKPTFLQVVSPQTLIEDVSMLEDGVNGLVLRLNEEGSQTVDIIHLK